MGEVTGIAWTDHTFNPWIGCSKVSPACDHCYAESGSKRLAAQHGLKLWEGDRFMTSEAYWKQPAMWNRKAIAAGERRRVFCASFADVFEDRTELVPRRERLAKLIEATPYLDWLLLTKRPENMIRLSPLSWGHRWPLNVWAGTTCEDQAHAEQRVPALLNVPASIRFISYEPALGPVDLRKLRDDEIGATWNALGPAGLDWVIVGGESGPRARPFDLAWARSIVDSCRASGVAPFVKQLGSRPVSAGSPYPLVDKKGGDLAEWPAALRVQEFPLDRTGKSTRKNA